EDHFGDGSRLGVRMVYRRQQERDGTARALLLGREEIGERPFLLAWGDILTERANYPRLLATFEGSGCDALLAVNWVDDPFRGAAVYAGEGHRIEKIVEKPPRGTATTHWNNAGIAVFRPLVFEYATRVRPSPRGEYEIPDAISAMIADGRSVRAFPLEGFWSDVGTPEDLAKAAALLSGPSAPPGGPVRG
ncbi:MAG: sugar phosphate nucleotidyltransferase, partial [Candidatus Binatia bacterium]